MNKDYEKLQSYLDKSMALSSALTLFEWDNETLAPENAMEKTAKYMGIISDEYFKTVVNKDVKKLLDKLQKADDLTEAQKAIVEEAAENYRLMEVIPEEEYLAFSELKAKATSIWSKAKENNDFDSYLPTLKKIIEFSKKIAHYQAKKGQKPYDALLDQYEKDFLIVDLDRFFGQLKEEIVPLLKKVVAKNDTIDKSFIFKNYDVKKQKEFNEWLASYIGFDFKKGVIAESAHPFTTNLHNEDVRITTHYFEDNLESAIFSTIHESGHALYEMGVANELSQTPVGGGASCGMHESQSRFFENIIGRSKAFWEPIYGKLVDTFPENLANVDLDHFIKAINKVQPDYIRTEADELTYCLHIMIRYEIEKKIFEEDYPVEDLPKLWQQLYEEYLGLEPMDDAKGILQDIHWAQGSFGYFPSYALGNAFASQIYHQMSKELKVDDLLRDGKVCVIVEYLRENIHKYGASRKARRLLKDLTGEEFNPKYYIEYLKDKFTKIYEL